MSVKDTDGTQWAMQVVLEFDASLFRHFRVSVWNDFVAELARLGLVPIAWSRGERPPPVGVTFDFRGLRVTCCRLDGIDFTFCDLGGANFQGSSLKNAKIGDCPKANLRNTKLQGAEFRGDVSGAEFAGAITDGTDFSHAYYLSGQPPVGLPPEVTAAIESVPRNPDGRTDEPFTPPLRARVTIHTVPW